MNKLSNKQDTFDNTNYHPEDEVRPTQPTSIMNGVFRLLGLDGAKLGAIAVNGIIFIAKMVSHGMTHTMNYAMMKVWDWYLIINYIRDRIQADSTPTLTIKL